MTATGLIITLVIGAIAGWLAGQIVKGHGQGLVTNIVVGVVGAFLASLLFPAVGLSIGGAGSILGSIIYATLGAIILLVVLRLLRRA